MYYIKTKSPTLGTASKRRNSKALIFQDEADVFCSVALLLNSLSQNRASRWPQRHEAELPNFGQTSCCVGTLAMGLSDRQVEWSESKQQSRKAAWFLLQDWWNWNTPYPNKDKLTHYDHPRIVLYSTQINPQEKLFQCRGWLAVLVHLCAESCPYSLSFIWLQCQRLYLRQQLNEDNMA